MRIVAGKFKGSSLFIPDSKYTRPLKDLVRESIFNLLAHSNNTSMKLEKSEILDLYAGSGSFGLECVSRKAKNVYFVENEKTTFKILEKNIEKLNVKTKTKVFYIDVITFIKKNFLAIKFDLIFLDPPYKNTNINQLIKLICEKDLLKKSGILVLHRNKTTKEKLPNCFNILDERTYGVSKIIFGNLLF